MTCQIPIYLSNMHSHFEAVKVAIKQDKTGYILTLSIHPDEISEDILRDFVGSRYQVVMVRLNDQEMPLNRESINDPVKTAAVLCKDPVFHKFLIETGNIFEESEEAATEWLKEDLGIESRSEIKANPAASGRLKSVKEEFLAWKLNV